MRVLFFMRSAVYVRNFESTLRMLAGRGHQVHVVADPHQVLDQTDLIGRLCRECPGISHSPTVRPAGSWARLGLELRRGLDYLRYLEPEYENAPKLRRRAEQKAPPFIATPLGRRLSSTRGRRRLLARLLRWADCAVPRDPAVEAFVREQAPDLVLVTPLVEPGSPQSEYLRAARALGVRTGLCVYSWDNLTNKGLIHDRLDLVTVWNQAMKDEAVRLHRVPSDRVVVTGAAAYDHWFAWQPRSTRETFCARVGLDSSRPYLLYLCSSRFIAPDEVPFVRRWVKGIRASSERLRDCGVLVRPHPQNAHDWRDADLSDLGQVVVWPRADGNPVDADSRADYFDSIFHSNAVVGVNTSAQIESAIVGRGVCTLLAPEFRDTQEGTLHFHHLRDVNGGLLHVAADMEEHVAQLEAVLCHPQAAAARCRGFLEAFVRPYGLDEPATPRLASALEAVAARGPARPDRGPWWRRLARPVLRRAATAVAAADAASDRPAVAASSAKRHPKARPQTTDTSASNAKSGTKNKEAAARAAAQAFSHALTVREPAWRMQQAGPPIDWTPGEQGIASALEPLWDADAAAVADLRAYAKVISGVRRSQYKGARADGLQVRLGRDLERLLEKGERALWVEEASALGGFGFQSSAGLYNEDTLRFFRVVSLLQDAALIADFRDPASRRTVWEIGGGWGGLAYSFKTLCPNVTYLVTGAPVQFLVSAVYLMTLFPTACFRFYDPEHPDAFWRDWARVDFAFAPEHVVAHMAPPSLDLVLDLMALERMTLGRIEQHVRRAYASGCRHFFSVCPVREPEPAVASPVAPIIDRWYWPHPVSTPAGLTKRLALGAERGAPVEHTYLLSWRRLRA